MVQALAVAGQNEAAAVQEVSPAAPGPGEVMVRVEAASLNGIDAAVAAGYLWDMLPHTFPVVLGRDVAGTVESVGDRVDATVVGSLVTGVITKMTLGTGTIAETVVIGADALVAVPAGVSAVEAAGLGLAAVTAHDLVVALALTAEDTVLVTGASGGVGAFVVQLAAQTGAAVVATARPGAATDFVLGLGATAVVDQTGDLAAEVAAAAPGGITAAVHAAGDPAALAALLPAGGRLSSALGASADVVGRDDVAVTAVMASATPEVLGELLAAVADGTLTVPVAGTYELGSAAQALTDFGSPKQGKLVILGSAR
ncbi:MAG: alcohol dehydrogenase catalytic domain-containing protein [Janthinobacterium lividum]